MIISITTTLSENIDESFFMRAADPGGVDPDSDPISKNTKHSFFI